MAEFLTPPKQDIVSRKDFLTPATILQFHIRGRHRGVRRCESGKPVSVPHRGSVNMSRVVPAGADTAASANDPTLGCRRNRVPSPLQNRQPSAQVFVDMWGPGKTVYTQVACNATASYLPTEPAPVHSNEHA